MQVNLDSLNCGICYSTIEDAVSCDSCGNSFCSQCIDDYRKISQKNSQILKCPMCNKKYFRPKKIIPWMNWFKKWYMVDGHLNAKNAVGFFWKKKNLMIM